MYGDKYSNKDLKRNEIAMKSHMKEQNVERLVRMN